MYLLRLYMDRLCLLQPYLVRTVSAPIVTGQIVLSIVSGLNVFASKVPGQIVQVLLQLYLDHTYLLQLYMDTCTGLYQDRSHLLQSFTDNLYLLQLYLNLWYLDHWYMNQLYLLRLYLDQLCLL